jgi:putative SOS response-associated peptidase YedK
MCGRFAFHSPAELVARLFDVEFSLELEPRYNIAPSQHVAALRSGESAAGVLEPVMLRWGLVPFWARDPGVGNRMINARQETVDQKPAYRAAFKRRRCVILADGFFEWRKSEGGKMPHYISSEDGQPFAMAGLWEQWGEDTPQLETCTIMTTAANSFMQALHHRMPVILSPENVPRWIDPAITSKFDLQGLLDSRVGLRSWEVSRNVNNPHNQGPELILEASSVRE